MKLLRKNALLPTPLNLSLMWNGGSLLGLIMFSQILSGFLLACQYNSLGIHAFDSVTLIRKESYSGWTLQAVHATGASMLFMIFYFHLGRSLYYSSYAQRPLVWLSGMTLFLLGSAVGFFGYVLPWGQMSFWGATVITSLVSVIPKLGDMALLILWGGFAVDSPTLSRFFALHFVLPLIMLVLILFHIAALHQKGSSNPLKTNSFKASFFPYYVWKDVLGFMLFLIIFLFFLCFLPGLFLDSANFIPANGLVTPTHIQPEWYFLFFYALLRSIDNKILGVLAMLTPFIMMFTYIFKDPGKKYGYWMMVGSFVLLTWLGGQPINEVAIISCKILMLIWLLSILF